MYKPRFIMVQYYSPNTVMPLADGPTRNLGVKLTLLQPGGQIMLTTLLLAHPDLKTQRQVVISVSVSVPFFMFQCSISNIPLVPT